MTLKEYLEDYASPETRQLGLEMIKRELFSIPDEKVRATAGRYILDIEKGGRDFRF
jgi:2-iminoacetate synthase